MTSFDSNDFDTSMMLWSFKSWMRFCIFYLAILPWVLKLACRYCSTWESSHSLHRHCSSYKFCPRPTNLKPNNSEWSRWVNKSSAVGLFQGFFFCKTQSSPQYHLEDTSFRVSPATTIVVYTNTNISAANCYGNDRKTADLAQLRKVSEDTSIGHWLYGKDWEKSWVFDAPHLCSINFPLPPTFIHFQYPLIPEFRVGRRGASRSLSEWSDGEGRVATWTSHQVVTRPHRDQQLLTNWETSLV